MEEKARIRPMIIEDYKEVYDLWLSVPGMGMRSIDDSEAGIKKFLRRNPKTCFTAVSAGHESVRQILGVILAGHDGRRGYIYHAAVRENEQGKKVGKTLVKAVENAMKEEGINKLALVAFCDNQKGNNFWEKQGYTLRPDLFYHDKSLNDENK